MANSYLLLEDGTRITLEDGSGSLLLEGGEFGRVQAVAAGDYMGIYRDIGDVFDLADPLDFSDSTVSQVPVGDPDYPVYGWMKSVPSSTPLFSWALASGGASSPRNSPRRTVL